MNYSDHELNIAGVAFWLGKNGGDPVDEAEIEALVKTFGPAALDVALAYLAAQSLLVVREIDEAAEIARIEQATAEIGAATAIRRARCRLSGPKA